MMSNKLSFNDVDVHLSPVAQRAYREDDPKRRLLTYNTRELVIELANNTKTPEKFREFDVNDYDLEADITTGATQPPINRTRMSLYHLLLDKGQCGEEIMPKILAALDNPNELSTSSSSQMVGMKVHPVWKAFGRCTSSGLLRPVDYLTSLINEPRINVEVLRTNNPITVLNQICDGYAENAAHVAYEMYPLANISKPHMQEIVKATEARYPSAIKHIKLLLTRDAVLDPYWTSTTVHSGDKERQDGRHIMQQSVLKPFIELWQREWDECVRTGDVESLTAYEFRHFFSLGKASECLMLDAWQGKEEQALDIFHQLPQWAQDEYPLVTERTALLSRMIPRSQVVPETWTHELVTSAEESRAVR